VDDLCFLKDFQKVSVYQIVEMPENYKFTDSGGAVNTNLVQVKTIIE